MRVTTCLLLFFAFYASATEPWVAPETASAVKNPIQKSDQALKAGRTLYADRCSDCHGDKGNGNGPGGSDLEKKPTSFVDPKFQAESDGEIFWKITQGHRPMPSYGRKLSDEQRWQLVHFLRTFRK